MTEIALLYNGNQIKEDLTFIQQANKYDKERKKMEILVKEINNERKIKYINEILCPECG